MIYNNYNVVQNIYEGPAAGGRTEESSSRECQKKNRDGRSNEAAKNPTQPVQSLERENREGREKGAKV